MISRVDVDNYSLIPTLGATHWTPLARIGVRCLLQKGSIALRDISEDLRERLAVIQSAMNVAGDERDTKVMAAQVAYRQKFEVLEHERLVVLDLLKIEGARRLSDQKRPEAETIRQPPVLLSEFIITKLHAQGPMTKDEIREEVDRAGYLDTEITGRTFHLTLMNISGASGRVRRLLDGRYAVPTRKTQTTLFPTSNKEIYREQ